MAKRNEICHSSVKELVARRARWGDGRLAGDVPRKSTRVAQVFGHGSYRFDS